MFASTPISLKRLRVSKGIKQSHLAEVLGVSQTTISRWERGDMEPAGKVRELLLKVLGVTHRSPSDAGLKRLVDTSMMAVHLICDETHRLLAASPNRLSTWRVDVSELLGCSLMRFATSELLRAEATLETIGWFDGSCCRMEIQTSANFETLVPIEAGVALWERIRLDDGSAARLVTTLC